MSRHIQKAAQGASTNSAQIETPQYNTLTQQSINELSYLCIFSLFQILSLTVTEQFAVQDSELLHKVLLCSVTKEGALLAATN